MVTQNQLNKKVMSILETIPGIVAFFPLLDSEKNSEVLKIEIDDKNIEISVGLVISRNVTSKNIEKEMFDALNFNLKENKYILKKLNIYIKGVK